MKSLYGHPLYHRPFHAHTRGLDSGAAGPLDRYIGRHSLLPDVSKIASFQSGVAGENVACGGDSIRLDERAGWAQEKTLAESPNIALRNDSFRNYADYMLTPEFERAIAHLIEIAENSRTAYMCAERVYFHCHRMLVSDWLVAHGHEVFHIDDTKPAKSHALMAEARIEAGNLIYRGDRLL